MACRGGRSKGRMISAACVPSGTSTSSSASGWLTDSCVPVSVVACNSSIGCEIAIGRSRGSQATSNCS